MSIDVRKIHCVYTKWLKGATVCVGNSIQELVHNVTFRREVTVTFSQDLDFPFMVGHDKIYRYCYFIKRGEYEDKDKDKKHTFKCPFCFMTVKRERIHGTNGKIKCDYCHVTAPADKWEEI